MVPSYLEKKRKSRGGDFSFVFICVCLHYSWFGWNILICRSTSSWNKLPCFLKDCIISFLFLSFIMVLSWSPLEGSWFEERGGRRGRKRQRKASESENPLSNKTLLLSNKTSLLLQGLIPIITLFLTLFICIFKLKIWS